MREIKILLRVLILLGFVHFGANVLHRPMVSTISWIGLVGVGMTTTVLVRRVCLNTISSGGVDANGSD